MATAPPLLSNKRKLADRFDRPTFFSKVPLKSFLPRLQERLRNVSPLPGSGVVSQPQTEEMSMLGRVLGILESLARVQERKVVPEQHVSRLLGYCESVGYPTEMDRVQSCRLR